MSLAHSIDAGGVRTLERQEHPPGESAMFDFLPPRKRVFNDGNHRLVARMNAGSH